MVVNNIAMGKQLLVSYTVDRGGGGRVARCRFRLSGLEKNKFCDCVSKGTEKDLGVFKQFEFEQTQR